MSRTTYYAGETGETYYAKPLPLTTPWGDDDVALSENSTTGVFSGTLADATDYAVYHQAGGSPASSDTLVAFDDAPVVDLPNSGRLASDGLDDTNVHSDTDTLLARLTSARATLLDNLSNLDAAISSRNATEPDNTSIAAILEDTGTTLPSQIESATDEIVGSDGDTLETLSDQIDGTVTMGAGSNAVTITVTDGSNPIESVAVWITTDVGGSSVVAGTLYTDANGQVTFYLDNGSYYVWQQLAGYNFTTPESITVAG